MVYIMFIQRSSRRCAALESFMRTYLTSWGQDEIEHKKKADHIVDTVLQKLDLNGDSVITAEELEKVGLSGLPNFDGLGAEGHHYDVESGMFPTSFFDGVAQCSVRVLPAP